MPRLKLSQHPTYRKILASLIGVAVGGFLLLLLRMTILAPAENPAIRPDNQPTPIAAAPDASKDAPDKQPAAPEPSETTIAPHSETEVTHPAEPPAPNAPPKEHIVIVDAEVSQEDKIADTKPAPEAGAPKAKPSKADELLKQGGEKLAAGKTDEAIAIFRQVVKLEPDNPAILRELAMGLLVAEKHKESVGVYKKIIELDPTDDKARYNLATSLLRMRDYYEAEKIYQDLLRRDPENIKILSNLGTLYYVKGKLAYAAEHWGKVVKLDPKNADAHTTLGEVFIDLTRYDEAMKQYSAAAALQPKNPDAWLNMAIAAHKAGSCGRALTGIERAIKLDPKNARTFAIRGDIFIDIYRSPANKDNTALDRALESWEQSLKIRPDQKVLTQRLEFYRNLRKNATATTKPAE